MLFALVRVCPRLLVPQESDVFDPSARNADASKLKILQQYDEKKKKEAGMVCMYICMYICIINLYKLD